MSSKWPKAGPNHVGSYQVSGIPYVTSSASNEVLNADSDSASDEPVCIEFPFVTKWLKIRNTGAYELRVGFSARGVFKPGEFLPPSCGGLEKPGDWPRNEGLHSSTNYFLIPTGSNVIQYGYNGEIQEFDVRCTKVYFLSDAPAEATPAKGTSFSLIAGLTTIPSGSFPPLTGSVGGTRSFEGIG